MRLCVFLATGLAATAAHGDYLDMCGYLDLVERLGEGNVPTGDGIVACMVEAESNGAYTPDGTHVDLVTTLFFARSGASSGDSSHATNVARRFAGVGSFTPDTWAVNCFEVNDWLATGWLHVNQGGVQPETLSGLNSPKVWNNSWVGTTGNSSIDRDALRRVDWTVSRDDTLVVVGLNNDDAAQPLLAYGHNTLSVGLENGAHAWGTVPSPFDDPGRMKPEIVAPAGLTSFAVPLVSSAAILLVDQVRNTWLFPAEGERVEVLKAVLLTGAAHQAEYGSTSPWTNNPGTGADRGVTDQPLDEVVGAGLLNVDRAHLIMSGSMHPGSVDPYHAARPPLNAWSLELLGPNDVVHWGFPLAGHVEEFTATAAWNRTVSDTFSGSTMADLELELFRVVGINGELLSLRGDAGLPIFTSGNIACDSQVDNVEHLHVQDLVPGFYVLRAKRRSGDGFEGDVPVGIAWRTSDPIPDTDLNDDGRTGVIDLLLVLERWGSCDLCPEDIDGSGEVNATDVIVMINNWD